ncbi:hypothetical protein BG004_000739 [Podila humilis]|nr:hypothetical protein BG004_000739 [Podila humilis]
MIPIMATGTVENPDILDQPLLGLTSLSSVGAVLPVIASGNNDVSGGSLHRSPVDNVERTDTNMVIEHQYSGSGQHQNASPYAYMGQLYPLQHPHAHTLQHSHQNYASFEQESSPSSSDPWAIGHLGPSSSPVQQMRRASVAVMPWSSSSSLSSSSSTLPLPAATTPLKSSTMPLMSGEHSMAMFLHYQEHHANVAQESQVRMRAEEANGANQSRVNRSSEGVIP